MALSPVFQAAFALLAVAVLGAKAKFGGWDGLSQYHIQTDEGNERFFKYQTASGQYRKEKRLQDGSVVGSYGWVDADGFLRLNDYVADDKGYRIVRSRMLKVGQLPGDKVPPKVTPTPVAVSAAPERLPPISLSEYLKHGAGVKDGVVVEPNGYPSPSSTPSYSSSYSPTTESPYVRPVTFRPYYDPNVIEDSNNKIDGVYITRDGFRYYLPRHYHEEKQFGNQRAGSFGYIDPFGIRRVVYYNTSPGSGFVHRKNNKFVGFNATPYDP